MTADEKLDEILRRIGLVETGIQNLGTRLEAVENELTSQASTLNGRLTAIESDIKSLRGEVTDGFTKLNKKIDIMNKELLEVKSDNALLNDRLDAIDKQPA